MINRISLRVTLVACLLWLGITARQTPLPIAFDERLMPGQPRPVTGLSCEYYWYENSAAWCRYKSNVFPYVGVTINTDTGLIEHVTIRLDNVSIGSLIAAWGVPDGAIYMQRSALLFWRKQKARAYLYFRKYGFSPSTNTFWISFSLSDNDTYPVWRGFRR